MADWPPAQLINLFGQGFATALLASAMYFFVRQVWPWFRDDWYPNRRKLLAEDMRVRRELEQQRHTDFYNLLANMNQSHSTQFGAITQLLGTAVHGIADIQKTLQDARQDRRALHDAVQESVKALGGAKSEG